ncbi:trans-sialidase [Trypanosoma conorhini]|uniref:Trans-sialidase n=1 Tax=Trypanosoma conorhini TaxID=83891 RepID=A0A3R7KA31_9TRYP|nr:trans-sialidase [Trypanosoma conorhini]RNE96583.1 trans-sialidase [Trypanosoma conorhini]
MCSSCEAETPPKEVELLKAGEAPALTPQEEGGSYPIVPNELAFYGHSLADVNGVLVALAVGVYGKVLGTAVDADIWAMCRPYGEDGALGQDAAWEKRGWTPQVVAKQLGKKIYGGPLSGPKAVVRGKQLFLLVSNFTLRDPPSPGVFGWEAADWDLALFVGGVEEPTAVGGGKQVSWATPVSLKTKLATEMQRHSWKELYAFGGARGVAVGEKKILFPLMGTSVGAEERRFACTVMYSEDNGGQLEASCGACGC